MHYLGTWTFWARAHTGSSNPRNPKLFSLSCSRFRMISGARCPKLPEHSTSTFGRLYRAYGLRFRVGGTGFRLRISGLHSARHNDTLHLDSNPAPKPRTTLNKGSDFCGKIEKRSLCNPQEGPLQPYIVPVYT